MIGSAVRLLRDRRGAMAALGALGLMIAVGGATLAIDLARVQLTQGRLQTAVDAATLAGARAIGRGDAAARAAARAVFDANMAGLMGGAELTTFAATPTVDLDGARRLRVEATARAPLALASLTRMFGQSAFTSVDVSLEAAAIQRMRGAEIAVVLDNSGSMQGSSIDGLRRAVSDLLAVLYGDQQSVPNLYVGFVPYAATVNIGRQHTNFLADSGPTVDAAFAPTTWKGCVMARSPALAETDEPPTAGQRFQSFLWRPSAVCGGPRPAVPLVGGLLCTTLTALDAYHAQSPNVWPQFGLGGLPIVDARQAARNAGYGPNLGCVAPMTPLTASRAQLEAAIPGLEAWHRGGTMAGIGLSWGWRLLSPRWNGHWRTADGATSAYQIKDYDAVDTIKVIILMTDGANGWYRQDYTSFGRRDEMVSAGDLDAGMLRLCDTIKDNGIILFTMIFGGSINATMERVYRDCASDAQTETRIPGDKYFYAPDTATLSAAFRNIGGQLLSLRLVE